MVRATTEDKILFLLWEKGLLDERVIQCHFSIGWYQFRLIAKKLQAEGKIKKIPGTTMYALV